MPRNNLLDSSSYRNTLKIGIFENEQNSYFVTFSSGLAAVSATAAYTNYTYDALSRVTNVTLPDFTNVTVVFNHWTVSAYDQNRHRKDYVLDAYDRITQINEYNIDPVLNDGVVYLYNTSYGYDEADQLRRIIDAHGNNFTFTYDSLGRRIRLNDPDIGEWNYSYDLAGNLVSQAGGGGNLVTGDGFFREYNTLNQLVRIRNGSSVNGVVIEEYTYDPYGERVKIWRNDSAGTVVYTPFRELMQIRNSSGVYNFSYIYDGSVLVAKVNPDGSKHYYHPDHLGSTTLVTDGSGNIVEETFYEPFGDVTSGGTSDVKLYTGQFSDDATGQYYYGARYYKPTWGKFAQPDGLLANVYDPQLLNRYAYAKNNPYAFADESGKLITYKVENYGGSPIIAIYQDEAYIGRVISGVIEKYTLTSPFEGGQPLDVTTYDYVMQRGSKGLGPSEQNPMMLDYTLYDSEEVELLSRVTIRDSERLFKKENRDWAGAIAGDTIGVLSKFKEAPRLIKLLDIGMTGKTLYTSPNAGGIVKAFVPGSSTLNQLLRDYGAYQTGQQIKDYRGEYSIGTIGQSEAVINSRTGSVSTRWGRYGSGTGGAYCKKNC